VTGYGIEQWEVEEMDEMRTKKLDPLFEGHPEVVAQRERVAKFVQTFRASTETAAATGAAEPVAWREVEIVRLINILRADEGDSVTLFCDNPDFNMGPNSAVECNGHWTDWWDVRFEADTFLDALSEAFIAYNNFKATGVAASNKRRMARIKKPDPTPLETTGVTSPVRGRETIHQEIYKTLYRALEKTGLSETFLTRDLWAATESATDAILPVQPGAGEREALLKYLGVFLHPNPTVDLSGLVCRHGLAIEACAARECSNPMAYETAIKRARDYIALSRQPQQSSSEGGER
jgi:hypothetical protein